jgi:hypothetical protein
MPNEPCTPVRLSVFNRRSTSGGRLRLQELTIDLQRQPGERWHLTPAQCQQARELLTSYKADLGITQGVAELFSAAAKEFVRLDYWLEMESLAKAVDLSIADVAVCNFYYDALKVVLGCTAFAVDAGGSVLHARNLDWWSKNAALARYTTVSHFIGGPAGPFTTVGGPASRVHFPASPRDDSR